MVSVLLAATLQALEEGLSGPWEQQVHALTLEGNPLWLP